MKARCACENPTGVPVTEALVLIGMGVVVGGIGYFFFTKYVEAQAPTGEVPGTIPGVDVTGSPTQAIPPSAETGGVGVFKNQTPGPLGPTAVSS